MRNGQCFQALAEDKGASSESDDGTERRYGMNNNGKILLVSDIIIGVKAYSFAHNGWWTGTAKVVVDSTMREIRFSAPRGDISLTAMVTILRRIVTEKELAFYANYAFACHHRSTSGAADDVTIVPAQPSGWCHGVDAATAAALAIAKPVAEYHVSVYGNVTMPTTVDVHSFRGMWAICLSREAAIAILRANKDLDDDETVREVDSHAEAKWELC
jgi:hypothetical protein